MSRFILSWIAVVVVSCAVPSRAAERAAIEEALKRQVIGPELSVAEVRAYTEARLPRMEKYETVALWQERAQQLREQVLARVVYRGQAAQWRDAQCQVEWLETIEGGPGYCIKKLRYEALPGMWVPALLYEPTKLTGKVPVMLNVNGHDRNGKAADYKQMRCINQAKRGMLALNVEWLGMGQLSTDGFSHACMNQLDLCGTSGLAPFYLSMKRGLDVLLSLEHADPSRVGVAGLSGGGWQTIFISSLDTRVTLTNPVAGYSSFLTRVRHAKDLGDSEQTPVDLATVADYSHLTAMLAPRPALLTYNAADNCCFEAGYALPPLLDAAGPIYKLYGKENHLRGHVNKDPGNHNFGLDNRQALYRLLGDHFLSASAEFDAKEIESESELKTKEELHVELPAENNDFNRLALALCAELPRGSELPKEAEAAKAWQRQARQKLAKLTAAKQYEVQAQSAGEQAWEDGLNVDWWRLRLGEAWTLPAVEFTPKDAKGTTLVLADQGRGNTADEVQRLLGQGQRVVAIDPFYFGESQLAERPYLFALLLSAVGDRPLGLQASQVAAVARWLQTKRSAGPVKILALGPRCGTFSLVAAALEAEAIAGLELVEPLSSLKETIEQNRKVSDTPELFCFGLLEQFDTPQLAAMVAPRKIVLRSATPRIQTEWAGLKSWYATLGVDYSPLQQ